MSGRLDGKVAIITGAGCVGPGWGNGRAACVRFAEEDGSERPAQIPLFDPQLEPDPDPACPAAESH